MSSYELQPNHHLSSLLDEMTLGAQKETMRRREMLTYDALSEYDQQVQVLIAGTAGPVVSWVSILVAFDVFFIGGTQERANNLLFPHFTYGYTIATLNPIVVSAHVASWVQDPRTNAFVGANINWGSSAPDLPLDGSTYVFSGVLHLNFQGLASPPDIPEQQLAYIVNSGS